MSNTVDGPDAAAFTNPNALEIARIQVQINALTDAKDQAIAKYGQSKGDVIDKQIKQLQKQQAILSTQINNDFNGDFGFDAEAVLNSLRQQRVALRRQLVAVQAARRHPAVSEPAEAPLTVRVEELNKLIALIEPLVPIIRAPGEDQGGGPAPQPNDQQQPAPPQPNDQQQPGNKKKD